MNDIRICISNRDFQNIIDGLERIDCSSYERFNEISQLVSELFGQAESNRNTCLADRIIVDVPEITDSKIKALWHEYRNGGISLDEYTDAMTAVGRIVNEAREVENKAEDACMMYNALPDHVRLLLNVS